MQNTEWMTLFRQIPKEIHPLVVLALNNRTEITVETIFRIESSYLILRGRQGGTTDGGLLFMVPFDQLTSVYLFKELRETEIDEMFGAAKAQVALGRSASGTTERPAPAPPTPAAPAPPAPAPVAAVMPAFGRPPEATAVARNNLLERLRAARQAAMPPPNGK